MAPCLIAVAKVVKLLESARLPVIKNTDKKLVCLLSVLYELKIFYDKVASSFMKDIVEKIQIKIHSEQLK